MALEHYGGARIHSDLTTSGYRGVKASWSFLWTRHDPSWLPQEASLQRRPIVSCPALAGPDRDGLDPGGRASEPLCCFTRFHATVDSHHCLSRVREPPFCRSQKPIHAPREPQRLDAKTIRRLIMKTILSALIALSVLGSVAVPASAAWDTKKFWEDRAESQGGGG